jgi:tetratricopeptide (TPR) repeat protein
MNPKASATLEKVREDRRRSNFKKALSRLEEAIGKFPGELTLYTEAIDIGMEAGESLKAIHVLKKSQRQLPDDAFELWTFAAEKVGAYNDPIVGRFMLEQGIRNGDLTGAYAILQSLSDHAAGEVLQHITTKKQAMSHAMGATLSAPGDVVSYTLGEALLHLRLGSLTEAMEGFVRALDEDSGVFKPLEPFLADLEKQHGDKGGASYALGYCHIAAGRTAKGVEALARAARRAPDLVPRVIETIESLDDGPDLPPQARDLKLAELYLEKGDTHRSCELFSSLLGRDIAMAGIIADALRTAVETIGDNLDAPFLFVEASITAGRREAALSLLRKIHRCRAHRSTLVEWLESKSRSERLSADVQFFFAETALSEGLYGKAIEIFKQMLSHPHGTEEQGAIKEILSKYQSVLLVQHFYTERFGASSMREREAMCEFERYDGNSFAASKATRSRQSRRRLWGLKPRPRAETPPTPAPPYRSAHARRGQSRLTSTIAISL